MCMSDTQIVAVWPVLTAIPTVSFPCQQVVTTLLTAPFNTQFEKFQLPVPDAINPLDA